MVNWSFLDGVIIFEGYLVEGSVNPSLSIIFLLKGSMEKGWLILSWAYNYHWRGELRRAYQPFVMFALAIEWNYKLIIIQELYYNWGRAWRMVNRTFVKIDIHILGYKVEGLAYPCSIIVYL